MLNNEISHKYDDILSMPHPNSKNHPRMARRDRAAQFSSFAALTGHEEAISETARLTDEKAVDGSVLVRAKSCLHSADPVTPWYQKYLSGTNTASLPLKKCAAISD